MSRNHSFLTSLVALAALLSLLISLPVAAGGGKNGGGNTNWWQHERERRQADIDRYLEENSENFDSFRTAPLAVRRHAFNFVGIQMIMFRLLTEIFPEIWGPTGDQMAIVGYGPDPWAPDSVMPLGTGYILSDGFTPPIADAPRVQINYATFTCMGCHSGSVTLEDGSLQRMVGGSNPTQNYFTLINRTVNDPRYTRENFKNALNSKPLGWVYGDPALIEQEVLERTLFNAPGGAAFFLGELEFISNKSVALIQDTLGTYTYGNSPNPPPLTILGMLDAFGANAGSLTDPSTMTPEELEAALPPLPAPTDFPAVWRLADRPRFEWGNEVGTLVYRSVAASLSLTAGFPPAVNQDNLLATSLFLGELPSTPYPFDVNRQMAARGAYIYRQACASCHDEGNTILMSPAEIGTDPGRAFVFTEFTTPQIIGALRAGCFGIDECVLPDGSPFPDDEILEPTEKYTALPLHGIWATAPYLHNGSVPTLYHLIAGDRPAMFFRGNTTYDQDLVGYTWDTDMTPSQHAFFYDTSVTGFSNAGHWGPEYSGGIDWNRNPRQLWDLLEYLKTL